jgi:AhpD family alkylhydroperoxidase
MTQKTRIEPLPPKRAGLLVRAMYRVARRRFGEVPEPFSVAAHHPRLLIANAVHETMLQSASRTVPASVRELAVFWTARTIGCSWCVDFGAMLQRLDGLDVDDLRARFGEAGVIELTYQIGIENMRARMYSALGITEQGFNSGDSCRVPWADPAGATP